MSGDVVRQERQARALLCSQADRAKQILAVLLFTLCLWQSSFSNIELYKILSQDILSSEPV